MIKLPNKKAVFATVLLLTALTGAALPDEAGWGDSLWITSDLNAPGDAFTADWERAACFDLKAQEPACSPEDLAEWKRTNHKNLSVSRSPVVFRRDFTVNKPVRSAVLRISGLGYYHAKLNGQRIGDHALAPNMTQFDVQARYNKFDVTANLQRGTNRIEVTVAPGRLYERPGHFASVYRESPVLRAVLELTHPDGTTTVMVTDGSWQAGLGPVRRAAFWVGEAFDATRRPETWQPVAIAGEFAPKMRFDDLPPQRVIRVLDPVKMTQPQPGVWVYDFGRMTIGKARVHLPAGARVVIRYAELLKRDVDRVGGRLMIYQDVPFMNYPNGTDVNHPEMIRPKSRGSAPGWARRGERGKPPLMLWGFADQVQTANEPIDWHASFDYTGFRYVEITGLKEPLPDGAVQALEIHNDLPKVGKIEIGHPALQAVADAASLSILLNTQGTYQDNPGAERMGGNSCIAALSYPHAWYAFDNQGLARKALEDSALAAKIAGVPVTVTLTKRHTGSDRKRLSPAETPINVIGAFHYGRTPLDLIRFYGDRETAAAFMDHCAFYFESLLAGGYPLAEYFADHVDFTGVVDIPDSGKTLRPTDVGFVVGACALWQGNDFLKAASLLGRDDLVQKVEPLLKRLRAEIDKRYLDPATGRYAWKTSAHRMGANTLAICAGLVPPEKQPVWIGEIVADIRKNNHHQTTGSRLTGPLFSLLAGNGYIEEAIRLTTRKDYPSPYAMLSITGGTISEAWGQPGLPVGASLVQAEGFAATANWIYESLVGIAPTEAGPGFKRFRLAPVIPESVPACAFEFDSPQGRIRSAWKQSRGDIEWSIAVPHGSVAEVTFPGHEVSGWTVNAKPPVITGAGSLELTEGTYKLQKNKPKPE